MRKQLIITLLFFICFSSLIKAQLIDNKLNIYFGLRNNFILGDDFINNDGLILPSFYANMEKSNSYVIKGIYKYKSTISFGAGIELNTIKNWNLNNYDNYSNSEAKNISINPIIQIHTSSKENGLFNRLKLYIQFSPIVGVSHATFGTPIVVVQSDTDLNTPNSSTDLFVGYEFLGGFEFIILRQAGIFFNSGYKNCWIQSDFYSDKKFSNAFFESGIFLRFNKNEQFYY